VALPLGARPIICFFEHILLDDCLDISSICSLHPAYHACASATCGGVDDLPARPHAKHHRSESPCLMFQLRRVSDQSCHTELASRSLRRRDLCGSTQGYIDDTSDRTHPGLYGRHDRIDGEDRSTRRTVSWCNNADLLSLVRSWYCSRI
jgi:hypothetical protein